MITIVYLQGFFKKIKSAMDMEGQKVCLYCCAWTKHHPYLYLFFASL